ncbi:MAG: hypothetical protein AAF851_00685 [Myxococcota bacterium]
MILCLAIALLAPAQESEGLSVGELAQQQQPADPLEPVRRSLAGKSYVQAAEAAYGLMASASDFEIIDEATYLLAKALYRLEIYHGALDYFARILEQGPDNRFFASALEWCLFISRRVVDDAGVNAVVAKYGSSELPEAYRDEFLFRLARYHYKRALGIQMGEIVGRTGRMDVKETKSGGLSFSGDIFGSGEDAPPATKTEKKSRGMSFEGDLFGTGEETPSPSGDLTAAGHLREAERYAIRVDQSSRFGRRARFLEGLVLFNDDRANEALSAFKDVVRATRDGDGAEDEKLRELAFFQLARTHFGAQQPSFSIFYYDRVDRDSRGWLDALYEESWAQFRLGSYERALGNLLTLHAPFFEDEYFPESRILKAVVYYENCRYPEAKAILQRFLRRYEPVLAELEEMTEQERSPSEYFALLDSLRNDDLLSARGDKADILARILEIALRDRELARLDAAQAELGEELERWAGAPVEEALSIEVATVLRGEQSELQAQAGEAVERRLLDEQDHIKDLVQQAIRIDIETARGAQARIEASLRSVDVGPKNVEQTFVEWTDDEKIVWPFQGEFWRDELGTYELTLARSCR